MLASDQHQSRDDSKSKWARNRHISLNTLKIKAQSQRLNRWKSGTKPGCFPDGFSLRRPQKFKGRLSSATRVQRSHRFKRHRKTKPQLEITRSPHLLRASNEETLKASNLATIKYSIPTMRSRLKRFGTFQNPPLGNSMDRSPKSTDLIILDLDNSSSKSYFALSITPYFPRPPQPDRQGEEINQTPCIPLNLGILEPQLLCASPRLNPRTQKQPWSFNEDGQLFFSKQNPFHV